MSKKFTNNEGETIDTNDSGAVSEWIDIRENRFVSWKVKNLSGGSGTHILTLQCAWDSEGVTAENTASTQTGVGSVKSFEVNAGWVRVKVTTPEGGGSSAKVYINAK